MKINEFEIPSELASDLECGGRQLTTGELIRLKEMLTHVESPLPKLYSREEIRDANKLWGTESAQFYLGGPSETVVPGDIDPSQTLIIGQAEPDSPIALDYRKATPRVIYLGDVNCQTLWIELGVDYASFAKSLRADTRD